jgi:hypothetical protein
MSSSCEFHLDEICRLSRLLERAEELDQQKQDALDRAIAIIHELHAIIAEQSKLLRINLNV